MKMIPYGRQSIDQADIEAVMAVLKSDMLTQGPAIEKFEKQISEKVEAKYAVAVSSATAALHIACLALDLKVGERLWTTPNTFVATSNAGLYCGASVDFVDIDARTYNICPKKLEEKLIAAEKKGLLPKIIIPVHFTGQSCEMDKISALSKKYGFKIIEDASHAIGGKYKNRPIGNGDYSDMAVFSFHPVKIVTTGEGGLITTNNKDLFEKLMRLRTHGITRKQNLLKNKSDGPWYYEQQELGYNYRITDIQAALGTSQLQKLDRFIARRHELVKQYNESLKSLPLILPWQHPDNFSAFHLYVVRLKLDQIKKSHEQVATELIEKGIGVNLHYIPVYLQPYYQELGFKKGICPEAEKYYSEALSIPLYASLTDSDQQKVVQALREVLI